MAEKKDKRQMVSAVFRDRVNAERAFDRIRALGYTDSEINVLMSDKTRSTYYSGAQKEKLQAGSHVAEGTGVGGTIGTVVGAALGAAVAVGTSLVLPGLGWVVAGPLALGLAGAGAGAISGGIVGALVGWGIPEDNARAYEAALKQGGIVLGVQARSSDEANRLKKEMDALGGEDVFVCS
jgi:hypothetical protein